ncbi:hypothetical protein LTR62_007352 [Meristemomyces frigidus]|uniref:Protein root UVB sensitive/RUS domain-containing protein n=1 Tax=Meristemomyces frigidus TaxID=1508187 RepID=A0AAN7THG7_9PEZI|nr:hypothetical protein LTR62_007352 [Meristemomyces frigidus]
MELTETDEAGNITATYISSTSDTKDLCRIDVLRPTTQKPWQGLLNMFLPAGYPHSVTDDYLEYQIYDSLQAFASSIAGLLSSRAVLSSVGVGDSSASPTAALLLSIVQDSIGRLATIAFADRYGTALEPECKMYRLLADVLNDIAFVLDCMSPAFPKPLRVVILSFSSVLRALCGVAAGSAKASLSAHFARWGNLGELNAKDSSQETVISLLGSLAGSVVVYYITSPIATWTTLMLLLAIHLETNRRAVRAVSMRTLNRQRATIVYHHLRRGHVPSPKEVSAQELIFERDGILRSASGGMLGWCSMGAGLFLPLRGMASQESTTRALSMNSAWFEHVLLSLKEQRHALIMGESLTIPHLYVVFEKQALTSDLLVGWWHALAFAEESISSPKAGAASGMFPDDGSADLVSQRMAIAAQRSADLLQTFSAGLLAAGWDLGTNALETRSSSRISVPST